MIIFTVFSGMSIMQAQSMFESVLFCLHIERYVGDTSILYSEVLFSGGCMILVSFDQNKKSAGNDQRHSYLETKNGLLVQYIFRLFGILSETSSCSILMAID